MIGVRDGVMTLQSFYQNGRFYIFEAGFRMGGAQNYILSEYQNGTNSLEYMINYALTGIYTVPYMIENEIIVDLQDMMEERVIRINF